MTTSTLHTATSAPAATFRPLLAIFIQISRSVRATLADFNRYMDAAHKIQVHDFTATTNKKSQ